jgi:hypothetical protein
MMDGAFQPWASLRFCFSSSPPKSDGSFPPNTENARQNLKKDYHPARSVPEVTHRPLPPANVDRIVLLPFLARAVQPIAGGQRRRRRWGRRSEGPTFQYGHDLIELRREHVNIAPFGPSLCRLMSHDLDAIYRSSSSGSRSSSSTSEDAFFRVHWANFVRRVYRGTCDGERKASVEWTGRGHNIVGEK